MDQSVIPFDVPRMLLADQSPLFLLEVVLRTAFIYSYAFLLIRWIGGRSVAQLSMVEFLLVIALGSAVGDPMFYPDVPLLPAVLVITIVVLFDKGLDLLAYRDRRIERAVNGSAAEAIRGGVIRWKTLASMRTSQAELFRQLRRNGIRNLGEVGLAYYEADGQLAVFKALQPQDGLPIVPPWEVEPPERTRATLVLAADHKLACARCGTVSPRHAGETAGRCPHCDFEEWIVADEDTGAARRAGIALA